MEAGAKEVAIFGAASESFSKYGTIAMHTGRDISIVGRTSTVQLMRVWKDLWKCAMLQKKEMCQFEGLFSGIT